MQNRNRNETAKKVLESSKSSKEDDNVQLCSTADVCIFKGYCSITNQTVSEKRIRGRINLEMKLNDCVPLCLKNTDETKHFTSSFSSYFSSNI